MRLLLTGFEPFGGSAVNPSHKVVRAMDSKRASLSAIGVELHTRVLPVQAVGGPAMLLDAIEEVAPDAVLCLGESSRARAITIERVFVNLADYRIADNAGVVLENQPIHVGGPAAYFATLPIEAMRDAVRAAGIPVEFSLSAGAFLCNHTAYAALHHLARRMPPVPAGFVHVPRLPEQVGGEPGAPSMALPTMIRATEALVAAIARPSR